MCKPSQQHSLLAELIDFEIYCQIQSPLFTEPLPHSALRPDAPRTSELSRSRGASCPPTHRFRHINDRCQYCRNPPGPKRRPAIATGKWRGTKTCGGIDIHCHGTVPFLTSSTSRRPVPPFPRPMHSRAPYRPPKTKRHERLSYRFVIQIRKARTEKASAS